jgi:type VI secretion system secreted protein VgrG
MSDQANQANRFIRLDTPLGSDVLLIRKLQIHEELGRPFEITADLTSEDAAIDFSKILGQKITITVDIPNNAHRYFNGYIQEFVQTSFDVPAGLFAYQATIVPWISLLALTSDCRVFQNMTVPQILKELFSDFGFSACLDALTQQYPYKKMCVQYRETALNFVHRLMEQEGIYYFFEHVDGDHTLVLCDSSTCHKPYPGYDTIPYLSKEANRLDIEHIQTWSLRQRLQPGSFALNDYDYANPKTILLEKTSINQDYAHGAFECYDAPGGFYSNNGGEFFSRIRLEEHQCRQSIRSAYAVCLGIASGYRFELTGFPRKDQNDSFLVTTADIEINNPDYNTRSSTKESLTYHCNLQVQPANTPFRSAKRTPKPFIPGLQTAVVTGPQDQDGKPYTSPIGSVKLQFRWDRYGKSDENSSYWIRTSQLSAGMGWGSMFVPRVGNEVVVAFEEGDPDRPLIIGRLYNGSQPPPVPLPEGALLSYISDDGVNAIRFNPTAGEQSIMFYSPHNDSQYSIGATYNDENSLPPV